ncbi:MAG: glutamine amidotransferase [Clostridia bacterium]|nr:glutamine amidotransferase [Clostridia bacterium]MBN2882738.1 glutamine amidotransferase [Clostridia bacterium]
MDKMQICHLYPDLLNLYGDRGNIISMTKRLNWRGIQTEVFEISVGEHFDPEKYDIVFIGGGQDFEQEILLPDLLGEKTANLKYAVESNVTFLAICGGYQLLGNYYKTWNGHQLDFTGAIDIHTIGSTERMIGNFMFEAELNHRTIEIAGFENHSGMTFLGSKVQPLGKIRKGSGNNGKDGTAGARYKNVFCSYSHGPLLPKNPILCDFILQTALNEKFGNYELKTLDDEAENQALTAMLRRLR